MKGITGQVLFLLILPIFAYLRGSLQIIDPRYTSEEKLGPSRGPFPRGHGHCLISGQPLSQPTSLAPPTGGCPCLSDHHCVPVSHTGPAWAPSVGVLLRRMTLLNLSSSFTPPHLLLEIQTQQVWVGPEIPKSI